METSTTKPSQKFRLNSVMFLVGTLLFLLPFVNIKCKGETLVSNNGVGLAFGINYKTSKEIGSNDENFEKKVSVTEKDSGKMYVAALIALLLGVAGVVLSIMNPGFDKINTLLGALAAVALIILMIQIKSEVNDRTSQNITDVFSAKVTVLTAEFTAWYYLSLISFIAAAFFSYWRKPIVISG